MAIPLQHFLMLYCFPVQLLIGLAGNGLNLLVLTNRRMRSGTNWLLAMLALADSLFLLAFLPHTLQFNHWALRDHPRLRLFILYANTHITTCVNTFAFASAWFVVAVSLERMMAVRWPLHARRLWSCANLFRLIFGIWAFALIASGHSHFTHTIRETMRNETVKDPESGQTKVQQRIALQSVIRPGWERFWGWMTTFSVVFGVLLPVLLVLLANLAILEALGRGRGKGQRSIGQKRERSQVPPCQRNGNANGGGGGGGGNGMHFIGSPQQQHRNNQQHSNNNNFSSSCFSSPPSPLSSSPLLLLPRPSSAQLRQQRRATLSVLVIACTFTLCQFPSALVHLWEVCWPTVGQLDAFRTAAVLSNFMVVTSKTANHFLLCLWSAHFRQNVRLVLGQLLPEWACCLVNCFLPSATISATKSPRRTASGEKQPQPQRTSSPTPTQFGHQQRATIPPFNPLHLVVATNGRQIGRVGSLPNNMEEGRKRQLEGKETEEEEEEETKGRRKMEEEEEKSKNGQIGEDVEETKEEEEEDELKQQEKRRRRREGRGGGRRQQSSSSFDHIIGHNIISHPAAFTQI